MASDPNAAGKLQSQSVPFQRMNMASPPLGHFSAQGPQMMNTAGAGGLHHASSGLYYQPPPQSGTP